MLAHAREREWDCTGVAGTPPPPPPPIVGAVERGKPPRGSRPLVSFPASSSTLAYCVSIVPPFSLAAAFLLPPPSTVRVTRTVQISIGLPCSHATRAFVSPLDRACVQSPTFGFLFFFLSSSPFLHLVTRGEEERRRGRFVMIGCRAPVVSRLFWKLKGERDGRCCRDFEIRRLESLWSFVEIIRAGRLIFLAGLEIESKWKKGRDKREIILVQVENRSEILFFLDKNWKLYFSGKRIWKVYCIRRRGVESKEGTSLEAKLSFL